MAKIRVTIETDHAVLKDLSPKQAKELRDILLQMFPLPESKVVGWPWYPYPRWEVGDYTYVSDHWTVTSTDGTYTVSASSGETE